MKDYSKQPTDELQRENDRLLRLQEQELNTDDPSFDIIDAMVDQRVEICEELQEREAL